MSKPKQKPILRSVTPNPEHECAHGEGAHSASLENNELAFLSLVFRTFTENQQLKEQYARLLAQTAQALVKTLELRDPYTYGHSVRVMEYTLLIGRGADLNTSDMRNLELAALFHDIGKVGVADCVLLKPGRLTIEEQTMMMEHPIKSAEIIELIDEYRSVVPGVRHHHERFDGEGYPSRLSGSDIPLSSRIILVADTFDAMTSSRPYRKALPIEAAYEELKRFSGAQFDPEFVKIFLEAHQKLIMTGSASIKKRAA